MAAPRRTLSLFVFIDALGWRLAEREAFMTDLFQTRAPLQTVFGYSSTCDPTILTGLPPRAHGHFAFFTHDPERSPFAGSWLRYLQYLPEAVTSRARVRRQISKLAQRTLGYTGYFNLYNMPFKHLALFDYTEKRDLYEGGGIVSGAPTVFDLLRARDIPFFRSDWRLPDAASLAQARAAIATGRPRFAYLYLAGLDAILHHEGTRGAGVRDRLAWYDASIRETVAQASALYDEVRVFAFSDHGMTDVTAVSDLQGDLATAGFSFGRDYVGVFDSTMARFWAPDQDARQRLCQHLEGRSDGRLLSDADLRNLGCDFPNQRYGEVFFLLNPGTLLCPSFMGARPIAGMHGYDPAHCDSVASFLSTVPMSRTPDGLADMFDLMLREADRAGAEVRAA
jgi:hypothetical protein